MIFVIAACIAAAGLVVAAGGVRGLQRGRAFRRRAIKVTARVTDIREVAPAQPTAASPDAATGRLRLFSPVVAFYTRDGREIQAVTSQAAQPCPYRPGQVAAVWYAPEDPTVVEIAGMGSRLGSWIGIGLGSLVAVVGGIVALFNVP